MNFECFENNLINKILNIIFINVAIFQNLLNFQKRKNDYKIFVTNIYQILFDKYYITLNVIRRDKKLYYYSKHFRDVITRKYVRILFDKFR